MSNRLRYAQSDENLFSDNQIESMFLANHFLSNCFLQQKVNNIFFIYYWKGIENNIGD